MTNTLDLSSKSFMELTNDEMMDIDGGIDPYAIVGGLIAIAGGIAKKNLWTVAGGVVAVVKGTDFIPNYINAIKDIDGPVYVIGP